MEFILPIPTWLDVASKGAEMLQAFRSDQGRQFLVDDNLSIEQVLPGSIVRKLTEQEMEAYWEPFRNPAAREPVYHFPRALPIAGSPAYTWAMAQAYEQGLLETEIPKLFFYADPGSLIPRKRADWLMSHLTACMSVPVGNGLIMCRRTIPT